MVDKINSKIRRILGDPNGYALYNFWFLPEEQELSRTRYGFLIFDTQSGISLDRQEIFQGLGSIVSISNPQRANLSNKIAGDYSFRVYKTRNVWASMLYIESDRGINESSWMHNGSLVYIRDGAMEQHMDDKSIEDYARSIARRRPN